MNKLMLTYLTIALFAMILNDATWARGGDGHGGGGHSAGGGGHRHAGGGHRHFRGGHSHRRHNHFNLGFGIGGYNSGFYGSNYGFGYGYRDPFFYPRPYPRSYNYSSTVVVPMTPPVYIQREEVRPPAQPQANYWYYCQNPDGYYPYVKQCPGGWLQVAPQPLTQ